MFAKFENGYYLEIEVAGYYSDKEYVYREYDEQHRFINAFSIEYKAFRSPYERVDYVLKDKTPPKFVSGNFKIVKKM